MHCTAAIECCSLSCEGGACGAGNVCASAGDPCSGDLECCSNNCDGTTCVAGPTCLNAGERCDSDNVCCSFACSDLGGENRCITGGLCRGTHDCCGGMQFCRPTVLGIERCFGSGFGDCLENGETCAIRDQRCSGLCAPDATGALVCTGGDECGREGAACMADGDCCRGNCNADGICGPDACSPEGASCTMNSDCCAGVCDVGGTDQCGSCKGDGVTCAAGSECCSGYCDPGTNQCGQPPECVPVGEACTQDGECCSGICTNGACASACLSKRCRLYDRRRLLLDLLQPADARV